MEIIKSFKEHPGGNNLVCVNPEKSFLKNNSRVQFTGKNNILFVEDNVNLINSYIKFPGDDAVVYLSSSRFPYYLSVKADPCTALFIGKDNYMNNIISLIPAEMKNIIIGADGLFSFGISVNTSDSHPLYSMTDNTRINHSSSVFIGDHVWLGQSAIILKGCRIGSGAVIGAGSVVPKKTIPSNCAASGNPAKIIRRNVFYTGDCVHGWLEDEAARHESFDSDRWKYEPGPETVSFDELDLRLRKAENSKERLEIILNKIAGNTDKNRFAL